MPLKMFLGASPLRLLSFMRLLGLNAVFNIPSSPFLSDSTGEESY